MTITRVVDGNTSAATNLNQLIDLMEGAESIDFLLMSLTATDFKVRLADAGGTRKFIIQDSGGSTVAYVDSDGNASFTSIALTSLVIPAAASPAQTADASVVWDSDGDFLTIGDGTSRKAFYPDTAGSDIASASTLNITDSRHRVTGTTGVTAISNKPAGYVLVLTFASTVTITHSSSLRLAGAANYTTTAEETLAFESDGTNWREIGRKPTSLASTAYMARAGSDSTERNTTSTTAVDLCTISGLSIPVGTPIEVHIPYRKTSGAAAFARIGLKINSTEVGNHSTAPAVTSSNNQAEAGIAIIKIGPRVTNYSQAMLLFASNNNTYGQKTLSDTAALPIATITDIIIKGSVSSASITFYVKDVTVYTFPTT